MKDCYTYLFSFIAPVAAESSARDIGGDRLYFSALCLDGTKKETRKRQIKQSCWRGRQQRRKLLKKIEELTLYVIQQDKRIDELQKKVDAQNKN